MSEISSGSKRRPLVSMNAIVATVAVVATAAAVYFGFVRDKGPRPLKLALVTWTQDPFWQPLLRGAQDRAKDANIELTIVQSEPTVEAQTKHIRELLSAGVDGIAISPNNAAEQKAILDEVTGKVPVVTFDTDAPETKRRRFVGIDNYAAGRVAAGEMREALPEGGAILISVGSVAQQHGRDRRQGVIDDLLERGFDRGRAADPVEVELKGPRFTVVVTATDDGIPARAVDSIAAALKAHPNVKGVIGLYSYSAPSALAAMKRAGIAGPVKIVGFDESDETQAAMEAGAIHSSVLQDSYRSGYETISVLADEARGVARGAAEDSPTLYTGINVMTAKDLPELRQAGTIRQPASASPATQAAAAAR